MFEFLAGLAAVIVAIAMGTYVANNHDDRPHQVWLAVGITIFAGGVALSTWPRTVLLDIISSAFEEAGGFSVWLWLLIVLVVVIPLYLLFENRHNKQHFEEMVRARQ